MAAAIVPDLLKFVGGIAVGWWMCAVKGQAFPSNKGSSGGAKKKAAAGRPRIAVPRPREELKMVGGKSIC
jgi:hypothetical protein